jgi:hypothetical protein
MQRIIPKLLSKKKSPPLRGSFLTLHEVGLAYHVYRGEFLDSSGFVCDVDARVRL